MSGLDAVLIQGLQRANVVIRRAPAQARRHLAVVVCDDRVRVMMRGELAAHLRGNDLNAPARAVERIRPSAPLLWLVGDGIDGCALVELGKPPRVLWPSEGASAPK